MQSFSMEIFADYFHFYLNDGNFDDDILNCISDHSIQEGLFYTSTHIGICTVRNMDVLVQLEIVDREPSISLESWDRAVECSMIISSGKLAIYGPTDYRPDAMEISIASGIYKVRIFYGGLDTLSEDGLDGDDFYHIILWPVDKLEDKKILKQWKA